MTTEQEIKKGNIEIDIFMGNSTKEEDLTLNCVYVEDLDYHSNWNSLMPVVEKISTIHYGWDKKEDDYDDCAYPRTFGMRDKDGNYMVRINAQPVFIAPKLIDATWQAVVWFIENNKNSQS